MKSNDREETICNSIQFQAKAKYKIDAVVDSYMKAIEEIINIPKLLERFQKVIKDGKVGQVMDEIVVQSKVEFNYEEAASAEE